MGRYEFLSLFVFVMAVVLVARTVGRVAIAWRSGKTVHDPATEERIARLESAVESLTGEQQRLLEGQRFFTQLMANRPQGEPAALPASNDGVSRARL